MSRLPRVVRSVLLALAVAAWAAPAAAQDANLAKRFAAAQKLYDDGAYTPALQEFKALAAETGSPNADLYVARCLRELGKLPEAYEALTLALRNATAKAEADPKYTKTRNTAAADLAVLEPRVGKILIAVASPPPGLTVTLNGATLPPEKLGVPVPLAIGEAVVRLHAPDRVDVEKRVTLKGGETVTLPLTMEAPGPVVEQVTRPQPVQVQAPPVVQPTGIGGARIAGIVTLGVGAAGMVTFAVAGVMANSRYDSISAACGGKRCTDPSFTSQIDGGRQLDIIADVGLGVGLAGLVGGTLLVALGGPKAVPPPVTAWVSPGGGGLGVRGAF